jgi:hypothetical protein
MLGMQSVPHRVQKNIFRQVVIRLKMHVGVAAPGWQDCMHSFLRCCRQILSLRFRQAKCDPRDADRKDAETIQWL